MIDVRVTAPPRRRWPSSRTPCGWERNPSAGPNGPAFVRSSSGWPPVNRPPDLGDHRRLAGPTTGHARRPKELHERRDHRRPEPKSLPRLLDRRDVRGRHRADRHGDQVAARRQANLSDAYARIERGERGWSVPTSRRSSRATATTTSRSGRGSSCCIDPRSTSCLGGPRPRARRSSRSAYISTRGRARSSSPWHAASSTRTGAATSPSAMPGGTWKARAGRRAAGSPG